MTLRIVAPDPVTGEMVTREMTPEEEAEHLALLPTAADLRAAMPVLTRAQLLAGLVLVGMITRAEMRAANSAVPAAVQAALDTLPVQRAVIFEARWLNFTEAHRTNDLVALLQAQAQLTDARTDELWLEWAAIP